MPTIETRTGMVVRDDDRGSVSIIRHSHPGDPACFIHLVLTREELRALMKLLDGQVF